MILIKKAWNNFKAQPEIWFFYVFLATSMLSVRKVMADVFVAGQFNEYTGTYFYLSDIFLILAVAVWGLIILYNKSTISSIRISASIHLRRKYKLFHPSSNVPRGTFYGAGMEQFRALPRGTFPILLIPLILIAWSLLSATWSGNASIALYRFFKLFEFYLLFLFLVFNLRCSTAKREFPGQPFEAPGLNFLRNIFRIIIALGLINALIGILQVILQHSLGLFWLKESLVSPDLPGIAKIVLDGTKYIRSYGLFPHPNILGGFLFLSILLTLAYRHLFRPSTNVPRGTSYGAGVEQMAPSCATMCTEWKNGLCKIYSTPKTFLLNQDCSTPAWPIVRWNKFGQVGRYFFSFALVTQIVAGILTFSKSAILGLILALAYLFWHDKSKVFHPGVNVPPRYKFSVWNILRGRRETPYGSGMEQFSLLRSRWLKKAVLTAIIIGLGIYLIHPDFGSIFIKSMVERLVYMKISLNMISDNFLAGIGSGQFILQMPKYSSQALLPWQLQPVHNVFLLIWSELGLAGFSLFAWLIWKLFHVEHNKASSGLKKVPCETSGLRIDTLTLFKALLIGFFVIALFDHYLWDIQQGQIMLWMVFGLLAGTKFAKPIY